jgi:ABC-2 type transport system permease protein
MQRLKGLWKKEVLQIIRDPSSLLITVFLPLLLLFLYGYGVSLDINHLRVALVLEDTAPDAIRFAESLTNSTYFDVKVVRDRREIEIDLLRGDIRGFVVVPSYFSEFRERKSLPAPIQVIADGSEPNTANFVINYTQGAFQTFLTETFIQRDLTSRPLVQIEPRYWYNEQLESRFFLLSGSLAIIMTLIGTLLTGLVVAREWERGTMEALLSTAVTPLELLLGKMVPYFVLGMVSMVICIFISLFVFHLPLRGSFFLLCGVSAVFLLCALSIGLFVSTFAKNQIIASQIALIVGFLPAYILSGFLFEILSMPAPIRLLTYLMPARYFVQCLQTLFLVGNVPELILKNSLFMLFFGLLFFSLTLISTKKRL